MKKDLFLFSILTVVAVLSRLVSHTSNFTAVGAAAVVAGLLIERKTLALAVPLLTMLVSDGIMNFYTVGYHNQMDAVYLGFALMTAVSFLFKQNADFKKVVASSLVASAVFFVVSNFGVWIEGQLYPRTMEGLVTCFVNAIPFFRNEILSTVVLSPVLFFATQYLLKTQFAAIALNRSK